MVNENRILFIHRSCGANLLQDGNIRQLVQGVCTLTDYNQNKGMLTDGNGTLHTFSLTFEGNDTTPEAYAAFFNQANANSPQLKVVLANSDTIIIKSCYPNNAIKTDNELAALKNAYTSIISFFASLPDKKLGIVTTPPLVPAATNRAQAARARQLATWLTGTNFGKNVRVFDFYGMLAHPQKNTLRIAFRRPWAICLVKDSHPNKRANKHIAPEFARWLGQFI